MHGPLWTIYALSVRRNPSLPAITGPSWPLLHRKWNPTLCFTAWHIVPVSLFLKCKQTYRADWKQKGRFTLGLPPYNIMWEDVRLTVGCRHAIPAASSIAQPVELFFPAEWLWLTLAPSWIWIHCISDQTQTQCMCCCFKSPVTAAHLLAKLCGTQNMYFELFILFWPRQQVLSNSALFSLKVLSYVCLRFFFPSWIPICFTFPPHMLWKSHSTQATVALSQMSTRTRSFHIYDGTFLQWACMLLPPALCWCNVLGPFKLAGSSRWNDLLRESVWSTAHSRKISL